MTKNLPSARYTVFLSVCVCVLVLTAIPASAIQRGTGGSGGNTSAPQKKSVVENLKQKWDNLDEGAKDYAQEKIIDPVKGVAKDKAKQAVKKGWNRLKNSKTLGPAAKKLAKKYGPAAKKIARLAGPAGQIYSAYGTGQTVGEKLNTYVLDPLTSAYYDKKQEELTQKLEREIAEYREQVQLDKQVREMQERQEKLRQELTRGSEELGRRRRMREMPHDLDADNRQQAAGESAYGSSDFLSDMAEILILGTVQALGAASQAQQAVQTQQNVQPREQPDPCEGRRNPGLPCSDPCSLCIPVQLP